MVLPALHLIYLQSSVSVSVAKRMLTSTLMMRFLKDTVHDPALIFTDDLQSENQKTVRTMSGIIVIKERRLLFDSNGVMSKMLVNVTVLMTFGLASPLLAVAVAVDSVVMLVMWRVMLGRYLCLCGKAGLESEAVNRLQLALHQALRGVDRGVLSSVCMSGVFWSIFVFDMMGDVYGNVVGACMVIVVVLGLPLVMWVVCGALKKMSEREGGSMRTEADKVECDIEMTTVVNPIILHEMSLR